ncbi:MAG: amidohydrolase [Coriobacteriales bacterium]|jgi:predicted amidohydrolase YtcJ
MGQADAVIKGTTIFTAETVEPKAGAVIISGNEIVAVVNPGEEEQYIGPDTVIYDAGDRLVCPGFNDSHTHFIQNGVLNDSSYTLSLEGVDSKDEALEKIKEFADSHPDNAWISGFNLNYDKWDEEPTKYMLDEITGDRPAYFASWDMHTAWMNSKALELAGYVRGCTVPEGGELVMDEDGEPMGIGKEPPVNDPVWGMANLAADMDRALGSVIDEALSYGVTATGCVWPYGGIPEEDNIRVFQEFERDGKLPIRVSCFLKMEPGLANPKKYEPILKSDHLRFAGLKQITDGVCEAHTGYLTEPYADDPSTCGEPAIKRDDLYKMIEEADANGYSVRLHAIGNAAVKQALDCFELVQKKHGAKGLHNAIEHIESCCPEDIERFAKLGVQPSMQPIHAVLNIDGYPKLLGEKWRPYMWPIKSLADAHAILAFGTDAPVWNLNPMEGIYAALERKQPWDGYPEGGFVPEQRIGLGLALQAYTYGAARVENFENRIGTLHAGKLADVVIMDRNLFTATSEEILHAKPLYTFIDGKPVYVAEGVNLRE